jgi:hypothetical protein
MGFFGRAIKTIANDVNPIVKGIPTKPGIKSDIKGYQKPKPVSFASALSGVAFSVNKASGFNRTAWKDAAQKQQEQKQATLINAGAFDRNASIEVKKAYLYLEKIRKENPALANEIAKRYPRNKFISDQARARAIIEEVLHYKKSPFKGVIGKNTDKWRIIEEEKKMKRSIASTPSMSKERMIKNLKFKIYEEIMGRNTGGQNQPTSEISKTIPDRGVDKNTFSKN